MGSFASDFDWGIDIKLKAMRMPLVQVRDVRFRMDLNTRLSDTIKLR